MRALVATRMILMTIFPCSFEWWLVMIVSIAVEMIISISLTVMIMTMIIVMSTTVKPATVAIRLESSPASASIVVMIERIKREHDRWRLLLLLAECRKLFVFICEAILELFLELLH